VIRTFAELRRTRLSGDQIRTFVYVMRAIALGRLPGEQSLSRRAFFWRFLIALVVSASLWYYVTDQENPVVKSQPFTLQVDFVHLPKGLTVRNPVRTITVYARGLQSTVTNANLVPIADFSGISPTVREATVPISIKGGHAGVEYTSQPSTLTVQLEPYVSKTVPVAFIGQSILPLTLRLAGQDISPKVITVSGPADAVAKVFNATVPPPTASITPPSPDSTSFSYSFTSVPQLLDQKGHQLSSVGLLAANTHVTVSLQVSVYVSINTVPVAPLVVGSLPLGYQLDAVQASPPTATIFGSPDVISSLKAIFTSTLTLQGITGSITRTTHLDLQAYGNEISLLTVPGKATPPTQQGGPAWTVRFTVSRTRVAEELPATVVVDHLKPGMQARLSSQVVSVYLTGYYLDIHALGHLTVHIDASRLVQGSYTLRPTISLPPALQDYAITPSTVHLLIVPARR
jgi:YbbR domain-containing protein